MPRQVKHQSKPESIAWLDEKGNVLPLDPPPYEKSIEPHEKHIQLLRDRYTLLALGLRDTRKWLQELEDALNGKEPENGNNEQDIETV